ncbi:MAG: ribbon-helix-helix protein, CopG family [Candidatus Thorarchaeota archaeon]
MAKKGRPESENPREKIIHIAVTEEKKEKLIKLVKKSNTTISEFIRQAIDDKIRRIENPNTYTSEMNLEVNYLERILEKQKSLEKRNELILERLDTYNQIVNTLTLLKPKVNNLYLKEKMEKIKDTLKVYGELKPNALIEKTNNIKNGIKIDKNDIKDILAYYNETFSITMKGGIKLNE